MERSALRPADMVFREAATVALKSDRYIEPIRAAGPSVRE